MGHPSQRREGNVRLKTILYWATFDGREDFYVGFGRRPFVDAKCAVTTCTLTKDLRLFNQSDVVLFSINDIEDLPRYRFEHQRFVFYVVEPPVNTKSALYSPSFRARYNFFNWTMTYRMDSDIVQRDCYGATKPKVF